MNSILSFLPLFSAFTWAISGTILKKFKIKNLYLFPAFESCISFVVLSFVNFYLNRWNEFFSYNSEIYISFGISYSLSALGMIIYIQAIKKTELGIVFTLATSIQVLIIAVLDKYINLLQFSTLFTIGAMSIILGVIAINYPHLKSLKNRQQDKNNLIGIIASLLCGTFWAANAFIADRTLNSSSVIDATMIRTILTFIYFVPINLFQYNEIKLTTTKKEIKYLIISALFVTISMLIWNGSLKVNTGSWTTVLSSSAPIFALTLGYIFLKEKLKSNEFTGIFICLLGVLLIILSK
jgi:drug/metabolite transporter (DMT)-like permease